MSSTFYAEGWCRNYTVAVCFYANLLRRPLAGGIPFTWPFYALLVTHGARKKILQKKSYDLCPYPVSMSAFDLAWTLLKSTPRRRPKGRGEPERPRKRTASLRTGAQSIDTQSRQARDDKSAFMEPYQMEGMPLSYHYDYGDRKNVEEILFDEYGYGMDDEMAEALLQHSPASANLRQYQYDKRRPEPMYDDEGKVIGDVKDF